MFEFINVKPGERSGLIITELLFDREQKFFNGLKIIHSNLRMSLVMPLWLFHILM